MKRARTSSSPAPDSSTSSSAHPRSRSTMASSAAASGASSSAPAAAQPPCPHLHALLPSLAPPRSGIAVHRSECTLCFDGAEADGGIDVCLTCFNGGCCAPERNHARAHADKTWHALVCNVRRRRRAKESSQSKPVDKVAIVASRDEDEWEYETTVRCLACDHGAGREIPKAGKLAEVVNAIMQSLNSAQQNEVKAWENELKPCDHTRQLEQQADASKVTNRQQCSKCDLTANLWLCLTCGAVSCGREQYGGLPGNSHAMAHFKESKHPVSVKQGTITAEGTADIYCYACDDERVDPNLSTHLAHLGISTLGLTKTEKTLGELNLAHNLSFDFQMTGEDGKELEPMFGPGLTGLENLGNSCYMASVLQALFSLPQFRARYGLAYRPHTAICTNPQPASCLECQMGRLADGLLSGRYSVPRKQEGSGPAFQDGIKPSLIKALIGTGHPEFSTARQQDADEFLKHFLGCLQNDTRRLKSQAWLSIDGVPTDDATRIFSFGLQQRLQCTECRRVRYTVEAQDAGLSVPVPVRVIRPPAPAPADEDMVADIVMPEAAVDSAAADVLPDGDIGQMPVITGSLPPTYASMLSPPPAPVPTDAMATDTPTVVSQEPETPSSALDELATPPPADAAGSDAKGKTPIEGPNAPTAAADAEPAKRTYAGALSPPPGLKGGSEDADAPAYEPPKSDAERPITTERPVTRSQTATRLPLLDTNYDAGSEDAVALTSADADMASATGERGDPIEIGADEEEERRKAEEEEKQLQEAIADSLKTGGSIAKIEYEEVDLRECLDLFTAPEELDYHCPACSKTVVATKQTLFTSFPDVLALQVRRFQLINWVPQKVDVPINIPLDSFSLDKYLGQGIQEGEEELPESKDPEPVAAAPQPAAQAPPPPPPRPTGPQFKEDLLAQMTSMGFSKPRCQRAFMAVGDMTNVDAAMDWLFANIETPGLDEPINFDAEPATAEPSAASSAAAVPEPAGGSSSGPDLSALEDMGFSRNQARKAMRIAQGNAEMAVGWLFENPQDVGEEEPAPAPAPAADVEMEDGTGASAEAGPSSASGPPVVGGSSDLPARYCLKAFISHKGPSIHSGHYVAHVRQDDPSAPDAGEGADAWVLFNDEKVVRAPYSSQNGESEVGVKGLVKLAYEYIFVRQQNP